MGEESLERQLVEVVRTVGQLQGRYLALLGEGEEGEGAEDTLHDYTSLCTRLGEWLGQAGRTTRATTLLHRAMVRCTETSHASLLLPVLRLMQPVRTLNVTHDLLVQGVGEVGPSLLAKQGSPALVRLATNLAAKVGGSGRSKPEDKPQTFLKDDC